MPISMRNNEMARRRVRKHKLHTLRTKYQNTKKETDHAGILAKLAKLAPWLTKEEFLKPSA